MGTFLKRVKATEPARLAEAVRVILAALVALGWVTVDSGTVNTVASIVGVLASWGLTRFVRRNVTPITPVPADPPVIDLSTLKD